ncbi:MAG: hypothetical protein QXH44_08670 [Pyrobaculum sp.]
MKCEPSKRAAAELGPLAWEMASVWCWCEEGLRREGSRSPLLKIQALAVLCLSSFAAVLEARGGVVRAEFEGYLWRLRDLDKGALGRARALIMPQREGAVPYSVFLTYAAFAYKKARDALRAAFGRDRPVADLLKELAKGLSARRLEEA